ncbi:uncharacterized protein SAMN05660297_00447 [Natronincola peptidivorans]|uniref:Radical SAM core domain-containing protein n=1 Tax=Natronincola peptidivorans TaxID=426128 RepID=A0A1H9YWX2_9FIRM|nr:thioether cross-link-forming SCIFF peptide maturase [Natronincola peptidivorans]SES73665.1 uncharacterized protein SAMN05660297_00447 [Natronincola peptidivorans]
MIHKFSQGNIYIVIDTNSGAVHMVDALTYDVLDYYPEETREKTVAILKDKYSSLEILECMDEIDSLINNNLLYSQENYLEHEAFKNRTTVVKALCLHIAHDCNIRCKYCFASQGNFQGERSLMTSDVGKKAIDFLLLNSGNRTNLEVDFFGGEPLMNFNVIKEIIDYSKEKEKAYNKNIRFTITTNGVALNNTMMEYINENMFNVVLSIDGRKEINDFMRYTVNGEGTYDLIVPKLKEMASLRNHENYYVRGTFTRYNLDFAQDVLHLADLGFKHISVEPVVATDENDYAIKEEDLPKIFQQYEYLAEEYIKRKNSDKNFNFFHFMIDLNQGPCVIKRLLGCGAGAEYLAVTPDGELYPCHQFVGDKKFSLGDIHQKTLNTSIYESFSNAHVYNKEACNNCWAKFYCSGGCHANAYNFNQNINIPYKVGCEMEKKRIECALIIQAKLLQEE